MTKPKIFVASQIAYYSPWANLYDMADTLDEATTVLFTGGADVGPDLYFDVKHPRTYADHERDAWEQELYVEALAKGKNFLGICRGAQFLCVMAGGKLVQHTENHDVDYHAFHRVMTSEGKEYLFNTLHHQMMYPGSIPHEMLAWCERLSPIHQDGQQKEMPLDVEPEVVWFPSIKALGIQCHPEYGYKPTAPALTYFTKIVKEKLIEPTQC